ncbi:MAG: hypothetical protein IKN78_08955 [Bacteroidales bacterium]|nr:hypothetical protein [Bacteroidales bacterium]
MEEELQKEEIETSDVANTSTEKSQPEGEDSASTSQKSSGKTFLYVLKVLLFWAIFLSVGTGLVMGVCRLVRRHTVKWKQSLSTTTEIVRYDNKDYQLRRTDSHKRLSKRYATADWLYASRDSIILLGKKDLYVIFSLKNNRFCGDERHRYKTVHSPDTTGLVAVVDEQDTLTFLYLHDNGQQMPVSYPVDDETWYDIRFKGEYCVIPHRNKGTCLINRQGDILLEGYEDISIIGNDYILATDVWDKENLYDAHTLRPLLTNKTTIYVTASGIYFDEGNISYLMDSTVTNVLTNMVLDDYEEYVECPGVATLYEPGEEIPSPYKAFFMNGFTGVFDRDYRVIIEPRWEEIHYLGDDHFSCVSGSRVVIMDNKGKMVKR